MTCIYFKSLGLGVGHYPTPGSSIRSFLIAVNTKAAVHPTNTNGLSFVFAINSPLSKFIPTQNITIHQIMNDIKLHVHRLSVNGWACIVLWIISLYRLFSKINHSDDNDKSQPSKQQNEKVQRVDSKISIYVVMQVSLPCWHWLHRWGSLLRYKQAFCVVTTSGE